MGHLWVLTHHFMGGTGVLKDIFELGDLSQFTQQVSDKAGNTIETILGPRPNAPGHYLKISIYQVSFLAHFPGITK